MIKEKSGQIVLINSVNGKLGTPFRTAYCGSKFGLNGFFDSIRAEVFTISSFSYYLLVFGSRYHCDFNPPGIC